MYRYVSIEIDGRWGVDVDVEINIQVQIYRCRHADVDVNMDVYMFFFFVDSGCVYHTADAVIYKLNPLFKQVHLLKQKIKSNN